MCLPADRDINRSISMCEENFAHMEMLFCKKAAFMQVFQVPREI